VTADKCKLPLGVAVERYDHILLHYLTIEHVNRSAIVVLLPFFQQIIHCLEGTAAKCKLVKVQEIILL
jgi:hypothetical protein